MKILENYGVVSLDTREINETDGGTHCPSGSSSEMGSQSYSMQWFVGFWCGFFGL